MRTRKEQLDHAADVQYQQRHAHHARAPRATSNGVMVKVQCQHKGTAHQVYFLVPPETLRSVKFTAEELLRNIKIIIINQ